MVLIFWGTAYGRQHNEESCGPLNTTTYRRQCWNCLSVCCLIVMTTKGLLFAATDYDVRVVFEALVASYSLWLICQPLKFLT